MQTDTLPSAFDAIAPFVQCVHRKSSNEYSGTCPQCGGVAHQNGTPPDRFVMFLVGRYGTPLGFCRKCGYRWTPAKGKKPTAEEIEYWRINQIEIEKSRIASAQRSIELLQEDKMWARFFGQNNEYSRQVFRDRGISDSWIDYAQLGLIPDYTVYSGAESYHSPAFTIPVWNVGGVVQNIKLRVATPREGRDRYRNYYPMGASHLFVPLYDMPLSGAGVIVEGEFKAIVMEQALDDIDLRVVGVQTKTPAPELFSQMIGLDPVYVWLDPDASVAEIGKDGKPRETAVQYVTRLLGKERVRVVDCPVKCDDGILQDMNPMSFIRMARKA